MKGSVTRHGAVGLIHGKTVIRPDNAVGVKQKMVWFFCTQVGSYNDTYLPGSLLPSWGFGSADSRFEKFPWMLPFCSKRTGGHPTH